MATPLKTTFSIKFNLIEFYCTLKIAYRIDIKTQLRCVDDVRNVSFFRRLRNGSVIKHCIFKKSFDARLKRRVLNAGQVNKSIGRMPWH